MKPSVNFISNKTMTVVLLVIFLILQVGLCDHVEFHRNTTGVAFSAYIRNNVKPDSIEDRSQYTINDVQTMMKVISGRFSKVATYGVGSGPDHNPYKWNQTYYRSLSQVYTGEAAARVNQEMPTSHQNPIAVYLGIWLHDHSQQLEMEISLAMESAQKANSIFSKTVRGLVLSQDDIGTNVNRAIKALEQLKALKTETGPLGLKLGTRQKCDGLESQSQAPSELTVHRMEIIKHSDFIICELYPQIALGVTSAFAGVKNGFLTYKSNLKTINPAIEVMGQTGVPGRLDHSWEIDDMREYWQLADKWAAENNFTMWMLEAFDNPWKRWDESAAHFGWWKLSEDSKTNVIDGYIEKVEFVRDSDSGQGAATTISPSKTTKKPHTHESRGDEKKNGALKLLSVNCFLGLFAILSFKLIL